MQSDSRLVELVREGHERAFEEIVRRYSAPLTRFAAGIVPDHRSDDIVQESFEKALAMIKADDRDLALKAWLYTIVRNRALNSLRDEPVHDEISLEHDGVPQPPDIAARRAQVASLVIGLKELPEQQRKAIVQRELEGQGHAQIASNLGVSAGAVRQLIFRARANLREGFGSLIPFPVLRALLDSAAVRAGGADAAILGTTGTLGLKVGVALLATSAAVGGGALAVKHRHGDPISAPQAEAAVAPAHHHARSHHTSASPASPSTAQPHRSADDEQADGPRRQSGHGDHANDDQASSHSSTPPTPSSGSTPGSGSGDEGNDSGHNGNSGSNSGSSENGGSDNSSSGSSHSGGGDGGTSGSSEGSGHSGSGSDSGSGSSGSGDSGSSGGSDGSGSGDSGGDETHGGGSGDSDSGTPEGGTPEGTPTTTTPGDTGEQGGGDGDSGHHSGDDDG